MDECKPLLLGIGGGTVVTPLLALVSPLPQVGPSKGR